MKICRSKKQVDYLKREGYAVTAKDVCLSVSQKLEGYMMDEHYVTYFEGAFVKCKEKYAYKTRILRGWLWKKKLKLSIR